MTSESARRREKAGFSTGKKLRSVVVTGEEGALFEEEAWGSAMMALGLKVGVDEPARGKLEKGFAELRESCRKRNADVSKAGLSEGKMWWAACDAEGPASGAGEREGRTGEDALLLLLLLLSPMVLGCEDRERRRGRAR